MAVESLTIRIPESVYARLEERAQQTRRSVEEALVEALAEAVASPDDGLPADVRAALAPLDTLPDDALREVARTSHLSPAAAAHLEELNQKRQREGLDADEQRIADALLHQFERAMLVRAEALARLRERGQSIADLLEPLPR